MRQLEIITYQGVRSNLDALASANGLLSGEPYLITDEARLAMGTGIGTYADCAMASDLVWKRTGTVISTKTAGDKLEVSSTPATGSRAIKGTAAGQVSAGVEGIATGTGSMGGKFTGGGWGILVISDAIGAQIQGGIQGAKIYGISSYGLEVYNTASDAATVYEYTTSALTDALSVNRREAHQTGGTPADGFGSYNDVELQTSTTPGVTASREVVKWTTAAHATATSIREWWLKSAGGAIARVFAMSGTGQPIFDMLGDGTFTGTAAYYLAVTSAGLVIEATPDESKWTRTGTKLTPKTSNDVVEVVSNGVIVLNSESTAILGIGTKGKASLGYGIEGEGLIGGNFKGSTLGIQSTVESAGTNDVLSLADFIRKSTGTPAAGLGGKLSMYLENASSNLYEAFRVEVSQTTATAGTESSQIDIWGKSSGTWECWFSILDTGQLKFHNYGALSFLDTLSTVSGFNSDGEVIDIPPEELQTEYFGITIPDSAEYIGRTGRYNRTTECNRTTAQQLVIKKNEFRYGEWAEFYQKGTGKTYLLKETVEITGATTPAGVNCRYHVTGQENGKDSYYNGVQGKRIYWDTDRWKVVTTIGGSVDFERVDANVLGAYTAVNGTGSPTAADCSSQIAFEGETTSNGQYTTLRMVCTDATSNANKFRVELINHINFGEIKTGSILPSNPTVGQLFLHIPIGRKVLLQYDGVNWIPLQSYGTMTLYVDATDGTDAPDSGTAVGEDAFATLQYAFDTIPPVYGGSVIIHLSGEAYAETCTLQGKAPTGNYTITIQGTVNTVSTHTVGTGNLQGTFSASTQHQYANVVRGAGMWSVNEVQNKFLLITSGNNNGEYSVIDSNTTTAIRALGKFAGGSFADNTDTFSVQDLLTSITDLRIGSDQKGVVINDIDINFADASINQTLFGSYTEITLNRCTFIYGTAASVWLPAFSVVIFRSCYFTKARIFVRNASKAYFDGCKFYTGGGGGNNLQADEQSTVYIGNGCILEGVNGYVGSSICTLNANGTARSTFRNTIRICSTGVSVALNSIATNLTTQYVLFGNDIMPNAEEAATSTSAGKLVDNTVNFITIGVAIGDKVVNLTDRTSALVTGVDSATQLSLASDIMTSGEKYRILAAASLCTTETTTATGGQIA